MSYTMKKAVTEIISVLKKYPEPGKKTGSFWDFMKNQLAEEGEWDQKHIKLIETEIAKNISKVDTRSLKEMWKETEAAVEAGEKNVSIKELKDDIADELMGQVMDRMDDNYISREIIYSPNESFFPTEKEPEKKEISDEPDFDEDAEPKDIPDEELEIDDDIFNEDDDDDEFKF